MIAYITIFWSSKVYWKVWDDKMQDFMLLLNLQPVNKVNDIVRMPDKTWIGFGGDFQYNIDESSASLMNWVPYYFEQTK